jgi:hypothetical protein
MRPGWFCVGRRHEVPKDATHVGHYRHTYVWVMPEGVNDLATFTLAILDIATALDTALVVITPEQVREGKIKATIERVKAMAEIYRQLPDATVAEKAAKARFEARLLAELVKLEELYAGGTPKEKLENYKKKLAAALARSQFFASNAFTDDERSGFLKERAQEFEQLVTPPPAPTPALRPRKEFGTFPFPPNVIPQQ